MYSFRYVYVPERHEYEIYHNNEIFCHLSETDFDLFSDMIADVGGTLINKGDI